MPVKWHGKAWGSLRRATLLCWICVQATRKVRAAFASWHRDVSVCLEQSRNCTMSLSMVSYARRRCEGLTSADTPSRCRRDLIKSLCVGCIRPALGACREATALTRHVQALYACGGHQLRRSLHGQAACRTPRPAQKAIGKLRRAADPNPIPGPAHQHEHDRSTQGREHQRCAQGLAGPSRCALQHPSLQLFQSVACNHAFPVLVKKVLGMRRHLTSQICPSSVHARPGPHEWTCAGVEFAEVDKVLSAYGQPNDPDLPQQWAMYKLGLFTSSHPINGVANAGAWNR